MEPQGAAGPEDGGWQDIPYYHQDVRPAMLVVAEQGMPHLFAELADAAGLRLLGVTTLAEGSARLDSQIGCDMVMLICPQADPLLERLLVQLDTVATIGDVQLVIVASLATIDLVDAVVRGARAHILCEPDAMYLSAALVAGRPGDRPDVSLHDLSRETEAARFQRLAEEVARLARTLDALTSGHRLALTTALPPPSLAHPSFADPRLSDHGINYIGMPAIAPLGAPMVGHMAGASLTAGEVRDVLRARRMRADFLPADLFADPAWDMLLDLLAARLDGARVSVSSLCIAAAVPPTTALRWIRTLTDQGLVERRADPHDGRRIFIALADGTAEALQRWFAAGRRLICPGLGG